MVAAIIITPATTPVIGVGIVLIVGIVLHLTDIAIPAIAAVIAMSLTTDLFPIATIAIKGNG